MTFNVRIIIEYLPWIKEGLTFTILICSLALPIGFVLGSVVCIALMSQNSALRNIAVAYVEVLRNIPFLILIFIVFFVLPFYGLRIAPLTAGIGTLSVYASAYFAEIIRGAILSVPKGQREAAQALGLRPGIIMRKIIIPQMLGYLIPPVTNIGITIIKESSVLSVITVTELTYYSNYIIGKTFSPFEILPLVAVIYLIITAVFSLGMNVLENRFIHVENFGRLGI